MKKKLNGLRVIISICAALGWWGLLWPELVLTPDTVTVVAEDGSDSPRVSGQDEGAGLYRKLLNADRDQIILRSRLLTDLSLFGEALHDRNGTQ